MVRLYFGVINWKVEPKDNTGMSESETRLKLTELEAKRAEEGAFSLHVVGPSAFMTQLLELQELQ